MSRMRILEEWNSFRREVIPNVPPEMATSLKKIFYAGVMAMVNLLLTPNDDSECENIFNDLKKELRLFRQETEQDAANSRRNLS